jgi:hypothetical protein
MLFAMLAVAQRLVDWGDFGTESAESGRRRDSVTLWLSCNDNPPSAKRMDPSVCAFDVACKALDVVSLALLLAIAATRPKR